MQSIFDYIKEEKWFFGVRAEESLFFYSAKYYDRVNLTKKYYQSDFVETLLFPVTNDQPIRVFNLAQAKQFHQESLDKLFADLKIVLDFIDKDKKLWKEIDELGEKLTASLKSKDLDKSFNLFKELLEKYGQYGNLFFINFSLGKELTTNRDKFKNNISDIIQKHDTWRNTVVFNEERMGKVFYSYLEFLLKQKKLDINPLSLMKYLTSEEVLKYAKGELDNNELENSINDRKNNGYIFVYLHDKKYQGVLTDSKEVEQIKQYFIKKLEQENQVSDNLQGTPAYQVKSKIKAEVVVIKDKNELKSGLDLNDKILVAIQTTPHYIPYLKEVKAIITDEGGITCHAAIVSREMKIPCIVGVKNATKVLQTGDLVSLDTSSGKIKKL